MLYNVKYLRAQWRRVTCHLLVADWLSIRDLSGSINQMTIFEIIIAVLHCFNLFVGLRVGLLCTIL